MYVYFCGYKQDLALNNPQRFISYKTQPDQTKPNQSNISDFVLLLYCLLHGRPPGVVANILDCHILVPEFELQSCYCIDFRAKTLGKGTNPFMG